MPARDTKRSDTYLAEDVAFDGTILAERPGGPSLQGAVETVLASQWWRTNVGDPQVVRQVQVRTASDSHWAPSSGTLALDPGEAWFVVSHELAHVAAGTHHDVHGPIWRGWNATMVEAVYGATFSSLLIASFDRFGLPALRPATQQPASPLLTVAPAAPARGGWRPGAP